MEQIAELEINLFAEQLPPMKDLYALSRAVHSGESNRLKFAERVKTESGKTSAEAHLAVGVGLFMLGKYNDAVERLQKAKDYAEKFIYLAFALRKRKKHQEAIDSLHRALDFGAESLNINLEKAATHREGRDLDAAAKELEGCKNFENVSAEYHYQLGRLQEALGQYDEAVANYKTVLELAPEHHRALFHLAYRHDLSGYESVAIDYYKQAIASSPAYVSALLNLAVLYEDRGEFEKACICVDKVLECHPNHPRAALQEGRRELQDDVLRRGAGEEA